MLVNHNSIIGVNSITADGDQLYFYKEDGTDAIFNISNINVLNTSGVSTFAGLESTGDLVIGGNVSVGGTLTYEDVTNVDSVGLITARNGLHVTGGNVGIGTENPSSPLEVSGTAPQVNIKNPVSAAFDSNSWLNFSSIEGNTGALIFTRPAGGDNTDGYFSIRTGGIGVNKERLRITSDGKVGIGTDIPQEDLHIGSNSPYILLDDYDNARKWKLKGTAWFAIEDTTAGEDRLRIDSSGNVAINKTSGISAKLHIGDTSNDGALSQLVKLANDSSGSGTGAQLNLGAGNAVESTAACIGGFYDGTGTSFIIKTTGTYANQSTVAERLRITSAGLVGIGTDNPDHKLHVEGTGETAIMIEGDAAPASAGGLLILKNNNTTANSLSQIQSADAGGQTTSAISFYNVDNSTNEGYISFLTRPGGGAPTEAARFNSSGNLAFPSGQGIDFSATGEGSGTMTSELLDDYEEGTWTPTWSAGIASPSYLTQGGTYTKIGRLVTIHVAIETNGGTNDGGQVVISGLPFQSSATARPGGVFMVYGNGLTGGSVNNPLQYIGGSVSTIRWYIDSTGGAWLGTTQNGIANRAFNLVGSYYTDA